MTVQEERQIKELAEMYARNLVLYGVDIREKYETAVSISMALERSYIKGRADQTKRYEDAIVELHAYRQFGTVEELKEAKEKQIPKTPCIEGDGYCPEGHLVYDTWICPNCEEHYEVDYDEYDYCPKCGQAIDKSVFDWEEGGESDESSV